MPTSKNIRAIVWITLLGLSACSVGPNFVKPDTALPNQLTREDGLGMSKEQTSEKTSQGVQKDWWTAYQSPEINALVELALRNNPTIESAVANLKVAQANVRAQQGFFFPTLGVGYNPSRQNNGTALQPAVNGITGDNTVYTLQTSGLTVGFNPDIWGGNRRQVESLKAVGNATSYQLEALRITVANNVVAAAIQEASLREQLVAVKELAESARRQLGHVRRMKEAGYSSGIDLSLQESLYAQAIAQVPGIEKSREQTLNLLNVLCGKMPSEKLLLPNIGAIKVPSPLPTTLPADVLTQRPDVKIAEEYVRAANAQVGAAIAAMLPQFNIIGNLGNATATIADVATNMSQIWSIGGSVNQTLFAGGTLLARKRGAEAATDVAVGQYRAAVLGAFQNVADTLYAVKTDRQYYSAAVQNEQSSKSIFEMSGRQLQVGHVSETAMLATQQSYLQARINSLQSQATYLGDTVSLYQALGGGWSLSDTEMYHQR